jgi:GNAT superfamily N-acetyltransferase
VDDGEPVGYGNLTFSYSTEAGGMVCWLEEIYLAPQARNRGLGGEYLAWVLKEYEDTAKRFRLEVCPANPEARRLYERHGFRSCCIRRCAVKRTIRSVFRKKAEAVLRKRILF